MRNLAFILTLLCMGAAAHGAAPAAIQAAPSAQSGKQGDAQARAEAAEKLRLGQALLDRLRLDPSADAAAFSAMPSGQPEELLTAVITFNQGYASNPAQWPPLHRAIAAMVELCTFRKQALKAAVYETFQSMMYSTYDENYTD